MTIHKLFALALFTVGAAVAQYSSPVKVVNTSQAPVPTRDVDLGARQPVFFTGQLPLATTNNTSGTFYTVPAGKRLVIESYAAEISVPTGQAVAFKLNATFSAGVASATIPLPLNPAVKLDTDLFVGGGVTKLYIDAGATINFVVYRSAAAGSAAGFVSVTGHLVDLP